MLFCWRENIKNIPRAYGFPCIASKDLFEPGNSYMLCLNVYI